MNGLQLRGCPHEDPEKSFVHVPVDEWNSSDTERVVYNRTLLFPLTRWIQSNRGENITHKKLDEFRTLSMEVHRKWASYYSDTDKSDAFYEVVDSVSWAMLHLWDVRGELRPWMAQKMCKVLLGSTTPDSLPRPDPQSDVREREFCGGTSSVEMALINISSKFLSGNKEFEEEEIKEAQESGQGQVKYQHDIEKYMDN